MSYYTNMPQYWTWVSEKEKLCKLLDFARSRGFVVSEPIPLLRQYIGYDWNGDFIYSDDPFDYGDRAHFCDWEEFYQSLFKFTPESKRPRAPEVTG